MKCRSTIFHARVDPVCSSSKGHRDTLRPTCVFASCGIFGSCSESRGVWGVKHDSIIFHPRVGWVWIQQNARRKMLRRTCVFASGGICGPRSAFECGLGWETSMHYFSCSGGAGAVSRKKHVTLKLCSCIYAIYRSRSAFRCVHGAQCRRTILHALVGLVWFL
jgi:hypothetical protein